MIIFLQHSVRIVSVGIGKTLSCRRNKWIFFFILYCSFSANAQDLLVTLNRDTLNCTLGKMQDDQYPITFVTEDEKISGLIHKDSVLFFKKNVFRGMEDNRLRPWYPLVEIGFEAGGAYQFGRFRIDDDLTEKSDFGARTGYYLGTDLTCYISKRVGYGLKYNYRSLLDGDIHYHYVGPMMVFRFLERKKSNHFFFSISGGFGQIIQKNAPIQLDLIRPCIKMSANSFSGNMSLGYSFRLTNYMSVRLMASCNIGYPNFIRIDNIQNIVNPSDHALEIGDYCHNMNTFNITAGFSFHK